MIPVAVRHVSPKPPCCRRGEAGGKTKHESSTALGEKQQGCNDYATAMTRSLLSGNNSSS